MADELTMAAVVDAIIEAGLRNHDGGEYLTPETPLSEIHFKDGDRTLAGIEFVCAFEYLSGATIPKRTARSLMSRLDNGRGTVVDLVAVIDRWRNPPPRKRRNRREKHGGQNPQQGELF